MNDYLDDPDELEPDDEETADPLGQIIADDAWIEERAEERRR